MESGDYGDVNMKDYKSKEIIREIENKKRLK